MYNINTLQILYNNVSVDAYHDKFAASTLIAT